jgi:hypothetical protein
MFLSDLEKVSYLGGLTRDVEEITMTLRFRSHIEIWLNFQERKRDIYLAWLNFFYRGIKRMPRDKCAARDREG